MADKQYKLTLSLSNGTTINAGTIIVPQGEKGEKGADGTNGTDGKTPTLSINGNGELIVTT